MTEQSQLILAGDIGGTKSNLAILSVDGDTLSIKRNYRFPSSDYPSLNAIIQEFLQDEKGHIPAACFGVPGPVKYGRAKPTNLNWGVDAAEIEKEFSIPQVSILNDLEANAYGISELNPEDFSVIQEGPAALGGNRCVVSPGTGLGEGGLFWDGKRKKYACGLARAAIPILDPATTLRSLCSNTSSSNTATSATSAWCLVWAWKTSTSSFVIRGADRNFPRSPRR